MTSVGPSWSLPAGGVATYINGANLDSVTAVDFGGVPATSFTIYSTGWSAPLDAGIVAYAPAGSPGTVDVTATNPAGTSAISAADQYTYVQVPVVSAISPAIGPVAVGTQLTISGVGLANAEWVYFTDTAGVTLYPIAMISDSDNQIVVQAPSFGIATPADIQVATLYGTSTITPADQFTYVPAATVSGISLTSGFRNGGDSVTITGTNLADATAVDFGDTPAGFTINTDNSITAVSPAGSDGTVDVTVATGGGTSATSAADRFTYVQPAPDVSGLSQSTGLVGGGTQVTITGTDLDNATAVDFGGVAATAFTPNSSTQITATAPAGSPGTIDVTVTTSGGTSMTSQADQFTYIPAPAVTAMETTVGPATGLATVCIDGLSLGNATAVHFGSTAGTIVYSSDTYVIAESRGAQRRHRGRYGDYPLRHDARLAAGRSVHLRGRTNSRGRQLPGNPRPGPCGFGPRRPGQRYRSAGLAAQRRPADQPRPRHAMAGQGRFVHLRGHQRLPRCG